MELAKTGFGIGFYVVSLVVSGVLFFGWRRLFRRVFRAEFWVVITYHRDGRHYHHAGSIAGAALAARAA